MPDQAAAMAEAYRRGILPPEMKAAYEEAQRRGLLGAPPAVEPEAPMTAEAPIAEQQAQLLATMQEQPVVAGAKEMIRHVPESAVQFAKDITMPFRHPVETAKGVYGLGAGMVEKFIPGEQEHEQIADAFGQMLRDRYGSAEQFKQTVIQDPVGALADIAGLFTGAGVALRGAGVLPKARLAAEAGKTALQAGAALDPASLAARGVGRIAGAVIPETLPSSLYERAAKFGTAIPQAERAAMTRTALEAGIMPTRAGVDKARMLMDDLNTQITTMLTEATETGQKIDSQLLFQHLDKLREDAYLTGRPIKNLKAIDRVEKEISLINKKLDRKTLTPQEAQRIKVNIYKDIDFAYGKETMRFDVEAQKAVARAAKEEIERIHPEIKNLNAQEGELIELLKSIQRSAGRISNRDLMGIGVPIKGTMGGAAAGPEGAAVGLALGVLDTPSVKARLAIALNKARKGEMRLPGAGLRAAAFQAGRAEREGIIGAP